MQCICSRIEFVAILAILLTVIGCGQAGPSQKNDQKPAQMFLGQEVNLVVPKSLNLPGNWELMLQEWMSQSGATIRWSEYDPVAQTPALIAASGSSGGSFILFPLKQLSEIESHLSSLSGFDEEFETKDLFKGLRDRGLTRERVLVANPVSVPVLVCYYRKDLLRAAHLKPPETWDDYHRLVESLEDWAPGLVAVEPLGPEFRATTFFARSLAYCKHPENYSVWFEIDSAKPMLNTPGFIRSIENANRTWKLLPPEVANYGPAECRQLILKGRAALGLTFEPHSAELVSHSAVQSGNEPYRVDGIEIGICRLPGSRSVYNRNSKKWDLIPASEVHAPALCGFSGLATGVIYPKSHFKETASVNLLISLNSPSLFDQAFATLPKSPCRESQLSFATSWFGPELSREEAAEYCDSVAQSLRDTQLVFELPVVGADEFRRAASSDLELLLKGDSNVDQLAETLQKSFEAIVDRLGRDAVRDSYRRGLGLGPAPKK